MYLYLNRLGDHPARDIHHLADLRDFRDTVSPAQIKARLTGRELEAALTDPRWDTRPCRCVIQTAGAHA
jgi:hypothetical protein